MASATADPPVKGKSSTTRKRPSSPSKAPAAAAPADAPKVKQTAEEWLADLKAADPKAANDKYPTLTNGAVALVVEYQIVTKGRKASDDLSPAHAKLLRAAAAVYPTLIDNLDATEKRHLTAWTKGELTPEQQERADDPKKGGLAGKARFIYVITGGGSKEQVAQARAEGKGAKAVTAKPKGESKPRRERRWREDTTELMTGDIGGAITFAATEDPTKGGALTFIGQWEDDEWWDKARAAVKRKGFDPDTCFIVTIRGRYARMSSRAYAGPKPAKAAEKIAA